MQDEQHIPETIQQDAACHAVEREQGSTEDQSSSLADANSILDIEIQANQLFDYIDKINTFADRAYQNAINQTEWAQRFEETHQTELINLRRQLEQSKAALQERTIAYAVLEKTTKAQLAEMEKRLREKEIQLSQREQELLNLTTEVTSFLRRKQEPDRGDQSNENCAQLNVEPLTQEIAALKAQLAKRDAMVQAKNNALHNLETDFHTKINELENAARDNAIRLEQQEATIKHKESLIQATAAKEVEIGKLIKRLSTECENLNKELQEKTRRLAQFEGDKIQSESKVKAWGPVVGRIQEEPT